MLVLVLKRRLNVTAKIAFQGELGAYSHQACMQARPDHEPIHYETVGQCVEAVVTGKTELAALPVENAIYGRVPDIHQILPKSGLFVVDETFVRIRINLLAIPGTELSSISSAYSHAVLLGQCRGFLAAHQISARSWADTAGAASYVAQLRDPKVAALASSLAGRIYGLESLASDIEDEKFNRTRFFIMSKDKNLSRRGSNGMITSFMFQVRNLPAALFKALGGFATNHVNMIKLESYMMHGTFKATQFFAEVEGHPEDRNVALAFEELDFFTSKFHLIGVYPAASGRM